MKTLKAIIETGEDNTFNIYVEQDTPFGFFGEGETVEQAKSDFMNSYNEMKELYKEETGNEVSFDFNYKYDIESFFDYYSKIFNMPALERLTGINQKQLHHYASGLKKPRQAQKNKIESALHSLGKELLSVDL